MSAAALTPAWGPRERGATTGRGSLRVTPGRPAPSDRVGESGSGRNGQAHLLAVFGRELARIGDLERLHAVGVVRKDALAVAGLYRGHKRAVHGQVGIAFPRDFLTLPLRAHDRG